MTIKQLLKAARKLVKGGAVVVSENHRDEGNCLSYYIAVTCHADLNSGGLCAVGVGSSCEAALQDFREALRNEIEKAVAKRKQVAPPLVTEREAEPLTARRLAAKAPLLLTYSGGG